MRCAATAPYCASVGAVLCAALLIALPLRAQQTAAAAEQESAGAQEALAEAPVPKVLPPLTWELRVKLYRRSMLSPEAIIGPAFDAAFEQAEHKPHEWPDTWKGFGWRGASALGQAAIGRTIGFGVAAMDGEDPRYQVALHHTGFWPRAAHAIIDTVVAHDKEGEAMPAYSHVAGAFGAAWISGYWMPERDQKFGNIAERAGTSLLAILASNLAREFLPDVRRAVFHKSK